MDWLKLYHEARLDAKLATLTDGQYRVWMNGLLFASEQRVRRGTIPPMKERVLALEIAKGDVTLLRETIAVLDELGIIAALEDGSIVYLAFAKRNARRPSDEPEATAARARRSRGNKSGERVTDESHALSRDVTRCHDESRPRSDQIRVDHDPPLPPLGVKTDPWDGFDPESKALLEGAAKGMAMGGYELPLRMLRQLESRANTGKVSEAVPGLWMALTIPDKARLCSAAFLKAREAKAVPSKALAYAASVVGSALEGGTGSSLADEAPKVVDPVMAGRPWYPLWCRYVKKPAEPSEGEVWNFVEALGASSPIQMQACWAQVQREGPLAAGDAAWEKRKDVG